MAKVNTVKGVIDSGDMGFTLMHEHLANSSAGLPQVFPELMDSSLARDAGTRALDEAYSEGIRSYVDVTTMDLGRDMSLIASIAESSKVNVILATGLWLDIPRAPWRFSVCPALPSERLFRCKTKNILLAIRRNRRGPPIPRLLETLRL